MPPGTGGILLSIGIHGGSTGYNTTKGIVMSDLHVNNEQELELEEEPVSQTTTSHDWGKVRHYLVNTLWAIAVLVWTVGIAYIAYSEIPYYTDNAFHTGSQIPFKYDGIRAISFTSESPVTLQIGEHKNAFLFVNTDDGSVAQSAVVSTNIQNAQGRFKHEFGPTVVSQGHWRRVAGDDFDNDPDFYLTSDSVITLTIYPSGSAWWVWLQGIVVALVVWIGVGGCLLYVLEWVVKQYLKLLGRYRKAAGS